MAGIFGRHNAHINCHLFDPNDPLVNLSDLEVFQRFRFRRDTIYFIVVEVGAKLRRPQMNRQMPSIQLLATTYYIHTHIHEDFMY